MANKPYNVHTDYDWTTIPQKSPLRNEAPFVEVHSFILNANQIQQALLNFIEIWNNKDSKDNGESFYRNMYSQATKEDDVFFFPYFSDGIRQFNNNFSDTFQSGIGGAGGFAGNVYDRLKGFMGEIGTMAGIVGGERSGPINTPEVNIPFLGKMGGAAGIPLGKPGIYIETPMFYQFEKNDSSVDVSFVLANTINLDSLDKNYLLIRRLTEINRPFRENSIAVVPPRIYSVKIPGHRFLEWAYCSNFDVSMIGARRVINGVIVPEGYQISMQFQSLTLEHAGFLNKVGGRLPQMGKPIPPVELPPITIPAPGPNAAPAPAAPAPAPSFFGPAIPPGQRLTTPSELDRMRNSIDGTNTNILP